MVSSKGGRHGYVHRHRHEAYRKMRAKGMSKTKAARIANAGSNFAKRSAMAKKGWRKRRRKG